MGIRGLQRQGQATVRDENLVGILQSLKAGRDGEGWGAGKLLAEFEERLRASGPPPTGLSRHSRSCTRVRRKLDRMQRAERPVRRQTTPANACASRGRCARLLVEKPFE
jgi:hypothetical protein